MFQVSNISRWQAFAAHLGLSLLIFLSLLLIIVFIWFPGAFIAFGGYQGIKIVAGVDLVLGPLLTLIIFNPQKRKELIALDLSIIGLIQVTALAVGVWLVYQERPIVQVLTDDGLELFSISDFKNANEDKQFLEQYSGRYPKIAFYVFPEKAKDIERFKLLIERSGKPYALETKNYVPIGNIPEDILETRLNNFVKNTTDDCFDMNIYSFHNNVSTCFSEKTGAVSFTFDR